MAKELKYINVIDVEATCWDNDTSALNEIIEIGISVVDIRNRIIKESASIIVIPTTTKISDFCTKLTTLTPEYVSENGVTFKSAIEQITKKFDPRNRVFASWGDYDRNQFSKQCDRERVKYPFGPTHLNVKNLFALIKRLDRECGVEAALAKINHKFTGTPHRGIDDSRNIGKLLLDVI